MKKTLLAFTLILFTATSLTANEKPRAHDPFTFHTTGKCGVHISCRTCNLLTKQQMRHCYSIPLSLDEAEQKNQIVHLWHPYNEQQEEIIKERGYHIITFIRDPRDAIVSLLFFMRKLSGDNLHRDVFRVDEGFDSLSLDEQLFSLMKPKTGGTNYINYYKIHSGWALYAANLIITYEDLVGEKGGGSDEAQRDCLDRIASLINLDITEEELEDVAAKIYQQYTEKATQSPGPIIVENKIFEHAQIGSWKTFFNEEHTAYFKSQMGQLLIELGYEDDLNW